MKRRNKLRAPKNEIKVKTGGAKKKETRPQLGELLPLPFLELLEEI